MVQVYEIVSDLGETEQRIHERCAWNLTRIILRGKQRYFLEIDSEKPLYKPGPVRDMFIRQTEMNKFEKKEIGHNEFIELLKGAGESCGLYNKTVDEPNVIVKHTKIMKNPTVNSYSSLTFIAKFGFISDPSGDKRYIKNGDEWINENDENDVI